LSLVGVPVDSALQLYREERRDLVVDLNPDGSSTTVQTGWDGLAARDRAKTGRLFFRSSPVLEDAQRLVRLCLDSAFRLPIDSKGGCRPAPEPILPDLAQLHDSISVIAEEVKRVCPGAVAVARGVLFEQQVLVARPGQAVAADTRRGLRLRAECRLARGGKRASAVSETVLSPADPDQRAGLELAAAALAERLDQRLHAEEAPSGRMPVVLAPGVGGVLVHEIVGHALEADVELTGDSWLAVLKEPVGPGELTVLDDPRRGRGGWRIDDEGTAAGATPLLRDGLVVGRLHDLQTAARANEGPTGHGRCSSFREPIRPRMGCTFIAPGDLRPDQVRDGIREGVYVRRMETGSTDPRSGRAVFRVTDADRIRNGKVDAPLKPFLLHVEGATALASMNRIGNDLQFDRCVGVCHRDGQPLAISVGAPTIWIGLATVNGQ